MTFEQYYTNTFQKWVDFLSKKIGVPEAEDRVQGVFTYLFTRIEFCEELLAKDKLDKYIQTIMSRQPARVYREQCKQVPTVNLGDMDFLSAKTKDLQSNTVLEKMETESFYAEAVKRLENNRKLPSGEFETVGELWQYIFIQYTRNGKTFKEIGKLVGQSYQNISIHYARIVTILTPFIAACTGIKLSRGEN